VLTQSLLPLLLLFAAAAVVVGSNITHFVTLTSPTATPLAGAKVSLTLYRCCGEAPIPGPSCTTGSDGICSVDIKAMVQKSYGTLSGLVEAKGHGTLVVNSISTPSYYEDETLQYPYVGELVKDRSIVMPGDQLHITGGIQEIECCVEHCTRLFCVQHVGGCWPAIARLHAVRAVT
jgi:hypothetical protein